MIEKSQDFKIEKKNQVYRKMEKYLEVISLARGSKNAIQK